MIITTINAKTEEIWETGQAQFITYKEKKKEKRKEKRTVYKSLQEIGIIIQ